MRVELLKNYVTLFGSQCQNHLNLSTRCNFGFSCKAKKDGLVQLGKRLVSLNAIENRGKTRYNNKHSLAPKLRLEFLKYGFSVLGGLIRLLYSEERLKWTCFN